MIDPHEEKAVRNIFEELDLFSFSREKDSPRMMGKLSVLDVMDTMDYSEDHDDMPMERYLRPADDPEGQKQDDHVRAKQDRALEILNELKFRENKS